MTPLKIIRLDGMNIFVFPLIPENLRDRQSIENLCKKNFIEFVVAYAYEDYFADRPYFLHGKHRSVCVQRRGYAV